MTGVLNKLYGTAYVAANALRQRRVPYLPQEQLRGLRDRQVRWMVRYAAQTVPYYRDLFRERGIDPNDIRTAEDLEQLPLIDKQTVRQDPQRFVSTSKWSKDAVKVHTGGRTGIPITVYHDRHSMLAKVAFDERRREPMRALLGRSASRRTLSIAYHGTTTDITGAFIRQNLFRAGGGGLRLYGNEPIEAVIETINHYRPNVIASYGSYLELLFRMAAARGLEVHAPKVILYGGDAISEDDRRMIEERFGCAVLSSYGAGEAMNIGFICEERTAFHLNVDLVHVRLVDPHGGPVPMGHSGEVVVSNLVDRAMVLLNYRLGDVAALLSESCPCGRTLPLLRLLEGRVDEAIQLPDGSSLSPRLISRVIKQHPDVTRYQLVQQALDAYELRLLTPDRAAFERSKEGTIANLRQLLGQSTRIEAIYAEELSTQPEGLKFKRVVSLLYRQPAGNGTPAARGGT
jgi:phenylacetate-CoA ligase